MPYASLDTSTPIYTLYMYTYFYAHICPMHVYILLLPYTYTTFHTPTIFLSYKFFLFQKDMFPSARLTFKMFSIDQSLILQH